MRHGDRPHNYVSNYIFGFAISSDYRLKSVSFFFRHPVLIIGYFGLIYIYFIGQQGKPYIKAFDLAI